MVVTSWRSEGGARGRRTSQACLQVRALRRRRVAGRIRHCRCRRSGGVGLLPPVAVLAHDLTKITCTQGETDRVPPVVSNIEYSRMMSASCRDDKSGKVDT